MAVEVPEEGSTEDHEKVRIARDRPLGVIHTGSRYAFGFGPDLYGIWDSATSGPPVEQFPPTDQGRQAGWRRYLELEPSASGTVITTASPDEVWRREVGEKRRRSRRRTLITLAVIALLLVGGGVSLALIGGAATTETKELSAAAKAKKAHVELTGALTVTEDLTQTDFVSTGAGSLIGVSSKGVWKGPTMELTADLHNPEVGTFTTTIITEKTIKFVLSQLDGTTVTVTSSRGECKVTLDETQDNGFSGSFECTGLTLPGGTGTVDATGTFGASSQPS
jgi:hypothetical protein